ncbi:hypothetical protein WN51_02556 [Melipona quadrifasciata]|uniref:Uncharacterized protein n=1 Tax=Melipona quadrifasciata TaxID=166423 RepID=A0A0M8ZSZ2_9HYME|nr:hypothetical protein WN51_02556 [Melipona quadrifasciata]
MVLQFKQVSKFESKWTISEARNLENLARFMAQIKHVDVHASGNEHRLVTENLMTLVASFARTRLTAISTSKDHDVKIPSQLARLQPGSIALQLNSIIRVFASVKRPEHSKLALVSRADLAIKIKRLDSLFMGEKAVESFETGQNQLKLLIKLHNLRGRSVCLKFAPQRIVRSTTSVYSCGRDSYNAEEIRNTYTSSICQRMVKYRQAV